MSVNRKRFTTNNATETPPHQAHLHSPQRQAGSLCSIGAEDKGTFGGEIITKNING